MNIISGVLFFAAFLPYILAIVSGETKPSPISWAIWASVDTLALLAMRKEKAAIGQLAGAVFGSWVVTVLAIMYGKPMIGFVECIAIAVAAAGIILWRKTGNAVFAVICSQIAVFAGAVPTFIGAYTNPLQEDPVAWSIWFLSCIFALFAIRKWDIVNALQPVNFLVIETIMIVFIIIRPRLF